jgi:cytochrome c oxidase subunit I+III
MPAILVIAGGVLLALVAMLASRTAARGGLFMASQLDLLIALGAAAIALLLWLALLPVDPWGTAFGAVLWAVGTFVAAHLAVVLYWALFNGARKLTGVVKPGQTLPDLLLSSFAQAVGVMTVLTGAAFLSLAGGAP